MADVVADLVAKLARKSTKKLIKSLGKKASNLVPNITPASLLTAALETTGTKENPDSKEVKQNVAALTDGK